MTIKAISLWNPWGTLVSIGAKKYETRHWTTNYRGPLVIHVAKTRKGISHLAGEIFNIQTMGQPADRFPLAKYFLQVIRTKYPEHFSLDDLPFGHAICTVNLVAIHRTEDIRDSLSEQEHAFGDYSEGRFAWQLEDVKAFEKPIPCRGFQGLWDWEL